MYNNELERQERYKKYAELAYKYDIKKFPDGKRPLYISENNDNGFSAYSLKD